MSREVLSYESVKPILDALSLSDRARIFQGNTQQPFAVQKLTIDLTTERTVENPLPIKFSYRSVYVQDATDTSTSIKLKPQTRDAFQSEVTLTKKDSLTFSYPQAEGYLYWSAQSGKSVTLIFFVDAEFRSGSQISQNSGGVSISEGSSADATARVTLSAATAAAIAPANSDRKVCLIENNTGADLFISGSNTVTNSGATRGIRIISGNYIEWRNTAALYGYSVAGGDVHYLEQE